MMPTYYTINSIPYPANTTVEIAITDAQNDRYVAITVEDTISYRPLTEAERAAKAICLLANSDMTIKFYRYGFFIDDQCVIASDTGLQRIVLSDFLPAGHEQYYCYGYDTDPAFPSCMCATNDVWKIVNDRYVYTGYYQVTVKAAKDIIVKVVNQEIVYQAAPIAADATFPTCDAINPQAILPNAAGQTVTEGTYYAKAGTVFTDGLQAYTIDKNCLLQF